MDGVADFALLEAWPEEIAGAGRPRGHSSTQDSGGALTHPNSSWIPIGQKYIALQYVFCFVLYLLCYVL